MNIIDFSEINMEDLREFEVDLFINKEKKKIGISQPFLDLSYLELEKIKYDRKFDMDRWINKNREKK